MPLLLARVVNCHHSESGLTDLRWWTRNLEAGYVCRSSIDHAFNSYVLAVVTLYTILIFEYSRVYKEVKFVETQ